MVSKKNIDFLKRNFDLIIKACAMDFGEVAKDKEVPAKVRTKAKALQSYLTKQAKKPFVELDKKKLREVAKFVSEVSEGYDYEDWGNEGPFSDDTLEYFSWLADLISLALGDIGNGEDIIDDLKYQFEEAIGFAGNCKLTIEGRK